MQDTQSVTLSIEDLDAMITNAVARATAAVEQVIAAQVSPTAAPVVEYGKTINLSDAAQVARSPAAKKVAKYFPGGDANRPISWRQRKRILWLAEYGLSWKALDGLTAAQAAVASHFMEQRHPVQFGDLVIRPDLTQ